MKMPPPSIVEAIQSIERERDEAKAQVQELTVRLASRTVQESRAYELIRSAFSSLSDALQMLKGHEFEDTPTPPSAAPLIESQRNPPPPFWKGTKKDWNNTIPDQQVAMGVIDSILQELGTEVGSCIILHGFLKKYPEPHYGNWETKNLFGYLMVVMREKKAVGCRRKNKRNFLYWSNMIPDPQLSLQPRVESDNSDDIVQRILDDVFKD